MIQDAARIVSRLTRLKCQARVAKDWFFDLSMFYYCLFNFFTMIYNVDKSSSQSNSDLLAKSSYF